MTVGERIKQKRLELNLSQDELAKKVGYKSRSSIQKIECARNLPLPKVEKMAIALGCTPAYLMGWEDTEEARAIHEKLVDAYIVQEEERKIVEKYNSLSPEKKALFEAYLKLLASDV